MISDKSVAASFYQKTVKFYETEDIAIPAQVRQEFTPIVWSGKERGPVPGLREFRREPDGAVWLGGELGAARFDPAAKHPWDRWQYFQGRAWLPDNDIQNIWIEPESKRIRAWIRTQTGVALIEWLPMTLEDKAAQFEERIEKRHVRHGLVADSIFKIAGTPSSNQNTDNDNDGLWTAMYLASQSYRYAVTKSPEALAHASRALRAMVRLEEITGIPGFPARSIVSINEPKPHGGEWHPTPDGQWLWKGDTSSDEIVGHYYGYSLFYDLAANDEEKKTIREVVTRITDYIIDHGFQLIDVDGKPTLWGKWDEGYFATPIGQDDSALNALELLAFLRVAHHITGNSKYEAVYRDRVNHGYAARAAKYRRNGGETNFSDDELAYLSYDPLLRYEKDPKLRKRYLDGLRFTWSQIQTDMNPLWNYISAASGAGRLNSKLREDSRRTLERIPMNLVDWGVKNSHRIDVKFHPGKDRFNRRQLVTVLPPDERAVSKWNGNPYIPDAGGNGHSEDDGSFFLLPYWMGRFHGWVR